MHVSVLHCISSKLSSVILFKDWLYMANHHYNECLFYISCIEFALSDNTPTAIIVSIVCIIGYRRDT